VANNTKPSFILKKKICHFTSVHIRNDVRIFHKQCGFLSKSGFEVHLVVADGLGDDLVNNIKIHDVGVCNNRFTRMWKSASKVYKKALEIQADLYHFHDPELIPFGRKLIKKGEKVIYDIHEDVPRDILSKYYIIKPLRLLISRVFEKYENQSARKFSWIITATPFIRDRFLKLNPRTSDINNFPILQEFLTKTNPQLISNNVCYIGDLTEIRGIYHIIDALNHSDVRLILGGRFESEQMESKIKNHPNSNRIDYHGFVSRKQMAELFSQSFAGLVTFLPEPNHVNAQPNKLFEYMAAGLPVICSNFPLWRMLIEKGNCGICVDPKKPEEIAQAINTIKNDPQLAHQMSENGKKAVNTIFNWDIEFQKLHTIYQNLLPE